MLIGRSKLKQFLDDGRLRAWRYTSEEGDVRLQEWDLSIGSNSIDVTLSDQFAEIKPAAGHPWIDPYDPTSMDVIRTTEKELILDPGQVILGCTRERFAIGTVILDDCYYDVAPMYDGRSTCGRLFLASHITAGYGDVGFRSAWTLEIKNMGMHPLKLYAGMRIGQVSFHLVLGEGGGYAGAYTDQHHQPKPPSLGRERF